LNLLACVPLSHKLRYFKLPISKEKNKTQINLSISGDNYKYFGYQATYNLLIGEPYLRIFALLC